MDSQETVNGIKEYLSVVIILTQPKYQLGTSYALDERICLQRAVGTTFLPRYVF